MEELTGYIDRKALYDCLSLKLDGRPLEDTAPWLTCMGIVRKFPAADVIERKKQFIFWQYCKDLNEINEAIETENGNWEQLKSADQIISVTYDTNHGLYVVIWRIPDEEGEHGSD